MSGQRGSVRETEHDPDTHEDDLSEILSDDRSRAVIEALAANDGELHVSELVEEVLERQEDSSQRTADGVVPVGVYTLVSGGGLGGIVGSYFELGAFAALSVVEWAIGVFGLLFVISVYATISRRRNRTWS
ncbi:hypothetical protein [Halegenticoccus tardaugens]|uniref:hypothetical protein n=1 Tax=Halegenticoccus tardaugens TaxID=2071624 RepID=UPI00100ACC8B|nr:hypothetical protein [Halegenticoccus tardaugens]